MSQSSVEIKSPLWLRILVYGACAGWLGLIIGPLLVRRWPSPLAGAGEWASYALIVVPGVWLTLALWQVARRMSRFAIRADDCNITLEFDGVTRCARWSELSTWSVEPQSEKNEPGWWVKLRDGSGRVVLEWSRAWCQSIQSDDALMAFIGARLVPDIPSRPIADTAVLRARCLWGQLAGVVMILICCWAAHSAWREGYAVTAIAVLCISSAGIVCLLFIGTVEVSAQSISHRAPLDKKSIAWAEITKIETKSTNEVEFWTFYRADGTIQIPGPRHWCGRDKAAMLRLVAEQIRRHQIEVI